MKRNIVIIGGVAGGATAAARLRRLDEEASITLLERGPYVSFANCGLPYHIGGVIPRRDNLLVQSAEGLSSRFALDIRTGVEAVAIDREKKTVRARRVADGAGLSLPYDALLLAPGAHPIPPTVPGADTAKNLFTLRDIPDTDAIRAVVAGASDAPRRAVVVGGGFIGLEMAENLRHAGVPEVTIVQRGDHVLKTLDFEMAQLVHKALAAGGVRVLANVEPKAFEDGGRALLLADGRRLPADLIVWAVGVAPESKLARDAGLSLNKRGAIITDERMRTSDPAIYAVGDAVEILYRPAGQRATIALAGPANKQARIVANNLCGIDDRYEGSLGTSVCRIFDTTAATTGLTEGQLKAAGLPYQALHTHPTDHAGYYPGAKTISIKFLYNPQDGTIWGAQAVGSEGGCKRIDVIAAAMMGGAKAGDLADLDLAYAPPYSSAKDPVNMLGFYAENVRSGLDPIYQWNEVAALQKDGAYLLDVREEAEFAVGAIPGAVNVPLSVLRSRVGEIPTDRPVHLYCQSGVRAHTALRFLRQRGVDARSLDGGYRTWRDGTSPIPEPAPTAHAENGKPAAAERAAGAATGGEVIAVDACGLQCPGPIVALHKAMMGAKEGQEITVRATDPGFLRDVASWAAKTGNTLLSSGPAEGGAVQARLRRGLSASAAPALPTVPAASPGAPAASTIVVFSEDLDKAMAALIIATGAAAMGRKVTLFFTFWGLNILRKAKAPRVRKDFFGRLFGKMMPRGPAKLPISKMNFGGMGASMMRAVMRSKHVDALPELLEKARSLGVKLTACAMSMDVMGIQPSELVDGIGIVGVATYLAAADESSHNLFI